MPKIIRRLVLTAVFAASAGGAFAAERVLLAPQPVQSYGAAARSAAPLTATQTKETTQGTIARLRATATKNGRVAVIVGYRVPFASEVLLSAAERAQQLKEIAAAGASLRKTYAAADKRGAGIRTFNSVPFAAMEVTPNELNQLIADPNIITIVEDENVQSQVANSAPHIGAPQAWALGAKGQGQTVAVIDHGFETNHPFLRDPATGQSKVVYEAACRSGVCTPGRGTARMDSPSHGTSVSGVIVGERQQSASSTPDALTGIAPDARLLVFGAQTTSNIIAALENIVRLQKQYKIAAVNMSLAFTRRVGSGTGPAIMKRAECEAYNPAVKALVEALRDGGTATVISAGNFGDKSTYFGSTDRLAYPACLSAAVSVGAVFSDRTSGPWTFQGISMCGGYQYIQKDGVICYSNTSPDLTLLAPGFPIATSVAGGGYTYGFDGTSAAAPHVAGAFAALRSAAPNASVSQIVEALRITGKPVKDYRTGGITPRLDIAQALAYLQGGSKSVIAYTSSGNGSGAVSFSPVGSRLSCNDDCSSTFALNSTVTMTAIPEPGTDFLGWESPSGECKGSSASCTIRASRPLVPVTAKFSRTRGWANFMLTYYRTGTGNASLRVSINGRPIECYTAICSATLPANTMVTFTAAPRERTNFVGWTGPCSGAGTTPTCTISLKSASTVTAAFREIPTLSLTVMKMGTGTITASVDGRPVSCSGQFCTLSGLPGTEVKLSAAPAAGNAFAGWSGLCTSTTTDCTMRLQASGLATATFRTTPGKLAANR